MTVDELKELLEEFSKAGFGNHTIGMETIVDEKPILEWPDTAYIEDSDKSVLEWLRDWGL